MPKLLTFQSWLKLHAMALANQLTHPLEKYAGKDPARLTEALLKHEAWVNKMREIWLVRKLK